MQVRKVVQSPVYQGTNESIAYKIDFANWIEIPGSPILNPAVLIKDQSGTDVSGTNLSGSPSVSGTNVITPLVIALTEQKYRLEITCEISGNTFSAFMEIQGEE